jgi:CheY-like chemotaxis protein
LRSGALPDLVILDQNMPRMDGIQTMRKIRELHLTMPILISSGQPDIQEWACFKQPKVAVIPKPFELDEILAQLARISLEFGNPQDS